MKPSSEFMTFFQKIFLTVVAEILRERKMEFKDVQKCSQIFLAMLPFQSYGDLEEKVRMFVDKFPNFNELSIQLIKMMDEEKKRILMNRIKHQINI